MLGELTVEHVRQVRRLLGALQKAADKVASVSVDSPERSRAIGALAHARSRLEEARQNCYDIKTSSLMIYFNKKMYAETMAVLNGNPPMKMLSQFGGTPWVLVQAVFTAKGVACPLEFSSFHSAYQEEMKIPS